ncbi:hypothetical protein [Rhodococcus jostii]|uniref:Uncharacterized protein n=1 Tax=Rhodococcus jostii TaxID=132919 RepID=A0ABU4CP97_RHOJO|nr:hypothetical protein [Rhodococcus jostii]MDV6284962.1 hypothetical protein [Rhodococcus jostii]
MDQGHRHALTVVEPNGIWGGMSEPNAQPDTRERRDIHEQLPSP